MSAQIAGEYRRRWKSVQIVQVLAIALFVGATVSYALATNDKHSRLSDSTLIYPYLAAACVYFLTCCWVLAEGYFSPHAQHDDEARHVSVSLWVLGVAWLLFLVVPTVGNTGSNAVVAINNHLFPRVSIDNPDSLCDWAKVLFNYLASAGNAVALASVFYVAQRCKYVTIQAVASTSLAAIGAGVRALHRLLIKASAVLVTGTLTLFLFFASAEQLQALGDRDGKTASGDPAQMIVLDCQPSITSTFQCNLAQGALDKEPTSRAPSIALGIGLVFTGILFFLFMTASMAIDERVEDLAATRPAEVKNLKSWREAEGFPEANATEKALQVLVLVAPAITGALTLIYGA